jgi:hypothetical protein
MNFKNLLSIIITNKGSISYFEVSEGVRSRPLDTPMAKVELFGATL